MKRYGYRCTVCKQDNGLPYRFETGEVRAGACPKCGAPSKREWSKLAVNIAYHPTKGTGGIS